LGAGHDHHHGAIRHERPLLWSLVLTGGFLVVELIGALLTNSLALLSDAAHMATDTLALAIALVAVRLTRRPPDAQRTFGYARLEAIGALLNGLLLVGIAVYILWVAIGRFRDGPEIATTGMLWIAAIGLVVNVVAMRLLRAGSGENLNVKGAYLEVWSDMVSSLAVLVGAAAIKLTGWSWIDAALAVLIGLWMLPRTWVLLREAANVLMEGVPHGVDLTTVRAALTGDPDVVGIHDLHVWALGSREPALTAHVVLGDGRSPHVVRARLAALLVERFHIHHSTLQVEFAHHEGDACATGRGHP
jgi:cobalt-zinc-cadmium efflux system protein